MKKLICVHIFALAIIMLVAGHPARGESPPAGEKIHQDSRVTMKWESPRSFETPESVCHDARRDIIYVSNINGVPFQKDNNGFISKLSMDGEIVELHWLTGLDAPKGMGVFDGKLYVTDIDQVVEIDIGKGEISKRYAAEEAQFLNDITVHESGIVYISDNRAGLIFRLQDGKLEVWLSSPELNGPNGLLAEHDRLLVGIDGAILSVGLADKKIDRLVADTDYIDGLVPDGQGSYLISDFRGATHLVHPEKGKVRLLDTTDANIMAADIDYVIEKNLLLVPTFLDNRVIAYEVK